MWADTYSPDTSKAKAGKVESHWLFERCLAYSTGMNYEALAYSYQYISLLRLNLLSNSKALNQVVQQLAIDIWHICASERWFSAVLQLIRQSMNLDYIGLN